MRIVEYCAIKVSLIVVGVNNEVFVSVLSNGPHCLNVSKGSYGRHVDLNSDSSIFKQATRC